MKRMLAIMVILLVVSNCDRRRTYTDELVSEVETATVMFYFPDDGDCIGWGGCVDHGVIANDMYIIDELEISDHVIVAMEPGEYTIHSDSSILIDRVSSFTFEGGKVYYIKMWYDYGFWVSSLRFTQTDKPNKI